ncbi:enoyl-CoA hydratase/isomerase family protein [Phaeobacter italicus]|uniref:enoyl-CoA hydratase/isomerase family protein n=1 Tax=Phaeobacter italicus TaxID=481446 RepID=UPI00248F10D9|nr:enoyl-CoA hydratase-related protein [Phaeobacter italicus]
MTSEVLFDVADHIATLTLNRPGKLNAFTDAMLMALVDALDQCEQRDDVRVVVLTGENSAHLTLLTPDVLAKKYRGLDLDALPNGAFDVLQVKVRDDNGGSAELLTHIFVGHEPIQPTL